MQENNVVVFFLNTVYIRYINEVFTAMNTMCYVFCWIVILDIETFSTTTCPFDVWITEDKAAA